MVAGRTLELTGEQLGRLLDCYFCGEEDELRSKKIDHADFDYLWPKGRRGELSEITGVRLRGYKGITADYELGENPVVLTGPNGTGKSACLEAVVYALDGAVPGGRSPDRVAEVFPPKGGVVTLYDTNGNWVERGISRAGAKISQILQVNGDDGGEKRKTLRDTVWDSEPYVLNIQYFLALSPERRREEVLKLCGATGTVENLFELIEEQLSKEILGHAGRRELLDRDQHDDLPDEIEDLLVAWTRPRGGREVVELEFITPKVTTTARCLRLTKRAHDCQLAAAHLSREAKAQIAGVEDSVRGVRPAALELDTLEKNLEAVKNRLDVARQLERETHAQLEYAAEHRVAHEKAVKTLRQLPVPYMREEQPRRPTTTVTTEDRETIRRLELSLGRQESEAQHAIGEYEELLETQTALKKESEDHASRIEKLKGMPAIELKKRAASVYRFIRDHLGDTRAVLNDVEKVCDLAEAVAAGIEGEIRTTTEIKMLSDNARAEVDKKIDSWDTTEADKAYEGECDELRDASDRFDAAEAEDGKLFLEFEKRHREWMERDVKRMTDAEARANAETRFLETRTAEQNANEKLLKKKGDADDDPAELEVELYRVSDQVKAAREASGKVKAYEESIAKGKEATIDEALWKHVQRAVQTVREAVVGATVKPLIDDIGIFLHAMGRQEVPYLKLENDRGIPIFELGWTTAAKKVRTSVSALSGGEAALFCAALSMTLTKRTPGIRPLLIEADPLDNDNLYQLLRGIAQFHGEFHVVLVATSTAIPSELPGWQVVQLEREIRHRGMERV